MAAKEQFKSNPSKKKGSIINSNPGNVVHYPPKDLQLGSWTPLAWAFLIVIIIVSVWFSKSKTPLEIVQVAKLLSFYFLILIMISLD